MNSLVATKINRLLDKHFLQRLFDNAQCIQSQFSIEIYDNNNNLFFSYGRPVYGSVCHSSIIIDDQTVGRIYIRSTQPANSLAQFWGLLLSKLAQAQWERRCITRDSLTRYRELALLYQLGDKLNSCLNSSELADIVLEEVQRFIRTQAGSILLFSPYTENLSVVASYGVDDTGDQLTPPVSLLSHIVYTTGKSEVIDDTCLDPRLANIACSRESLLCVPLKIDNRILGVLNLRHKTSEFCFSSADMKLAEIIATQAAKAFESARLFKEIENMAYAIILAAGATIDERDTCTAGHSTRVAAISLAIAKRLNQLRETSPTVKQQLSFINLQEIEYAAQLHDIGKIGVPEAILTKRTRLSQDRMLAIRTRFDYITVTTGQNLAKEFSLISTLNEAHNISASDVASIKNLARRRYTDLAGIIQPFLLPEEEEALCVPHGNLISKEFHQIQSHAEKSYKILKQIPFPPHLQRIPIIAYQHHERLNGSGYPNGLRAEEILLEAKIISVADVFEALTASDRPYRTPVSIEKALEILYEETKAGRLDKLVVDTLATIISTNRQEWIHLFNPLSGDKPNTAYKALY